MRKIADIGLCDVQAVYSGPEGQLWELVMGQQIHIGGFRSSMELAEKAGIGAGMAGVDLCCCNGAGMRFLVRFRNVAQMHGVDATKTVVEQGRSRNEAEGLRNQAEGFRDEAKGFHNQADGHRAEMADVRRLMELQVSEWLALKNQLPAAVPGV